MNVSTRQLFFILLVTVTILFSLEMTHYTVLTTVWKSMNNVRLDPTQHLSTSGIDTTPAERSSCPNIINGMFNGKWNTRPLTTEERTEMETFLESVRTSHGLPKSMQRADTMCGTVSYPEKKWFRALCDPKGPTPCCYNDRCVDKSTDKCLCPNCYDLRTSIHAEYSTWKPADSRCQVKNYTATEAIHLLQGTQLLVVGDSLMRHLYTALLLVLSNNGFDGALRPQLPRGVRGQCSGLYTFTNVCRNKIKLQATFKDRNDSVSVRYLSASHTSQAGQFMSMVQRLLSKPKTYILVSLGMASSFSPTFYRDFILPTIKMLESKNTKWPRIIWATYHMFGILKTKFQGSEAAKVYNQFMRIQLRQHDIPIFDISNITVGVMSPDGGHFGLGINVMKVQMFLNFFEDLKRKGQP